MADVRNRLAVVAGGLLAISLVIAVEVTGTHSPEHASAWAAAAWLEQTTFWLGIVGAAAALAAWFIEEVRRRG
jgi:hypothetical protein